MAGITPYEIQKVTVTVPDESGDYVVGTWVLAEDTGPDAVYVEGPYNTGAMTPGTALGALLSGAGYDTSDLP